MFLKSSAVAGMALALGLTGSVQAQPFNIWSASQNAETAKFETVQHRRYYRHRHGGINPGAAIAIGTIGAIAGAAAVAGSRDRYYGCDPYYEYCGEPRRVYRERVYRDYDDDYRPNRPNNYPTDMD